jgi:pterin-4a-carbinolamine dehydratase
MDGMINISSFIVRIVQSKTTDRSDSYRFSIRHIQTNREFHFADWDETIGFMKSIVSLETSNLVNPDGEVTPNGESDG